jgi:hypothetical protein
LIFSPKSIAKEQLREALRVQEQHIKEENVQKKKKKRGRKKIDISLFLSCFMLSLFEVTEPSSFLVVQGSIAKPLMVKG